MTSAAASVSVMPSVAKECTSARETAPNTSGSEPVALALSTRERNSSSPTATMFTLIPACCSKRSTMALVAATRWGSSSAVQKVSVSSLRFSLPVLPQAAAVSTAMTTMARRHLPHFIDAS